MSSEKACERTLAARDRYESFGGRRKCGRPLAPGESVCKVHLAADKRSEAANAARDVKEAEYLRQYDAEWEVRRLLGLGKWTDMLANLREMIGEE